MPVSELTDRILVESKLADLYRLDEQEERLENLSGTYKPDERVRAVTNRRR